MEKLIFQKNTEATTNKMRIPKFFVKKWGNKYYMEVYNDKIIIKPLKTRKGE